MFQFRVKPLPESRHFSKIGEVGADVWVDDLLPPMAERVARRYLLLALWDVLSLQRGPEETNLEHLKDHRHFGRMSHFIKDFGVFADVPELPADEIGFGCASPEK